MRALVTTPLAAIASLIFVSTSVAVEAPRVEGTLVAVIDVAKVFEKHNGFNGRMEAIKAEVEAFEEQIKQERAALQARAEQAKEYNPGSPEYKQLEAEIAKADADLQIRAAQKRKEVLDKEAQIYYDTYLEVVDAVGRIADANSIGLVLRYDSSQIDPSDRASVIKGVNRNVVHNRGYDLTEMVVELVNQGGPAAGTARPNPSGINR